MARVVLSRALNERVAAMVRDKVSKIADDAAEDIKAGAPPTKRWQSMEDDRVRHTHKRANGQEVPENLRFEVKSMDWDREHRGLGPQTYMLAPRDETSRAVANIINCRCVPVVLPDGIRDHVEASDAVVAGEKVTASVTCDAPLVRACEHGDVYPGGMVSPGSFFFAKGVAATRARLRGDG
jgi:hypothetical protein